MPEQLDISPKELELLQEKIRRTNLLKKEYLRHIHNPYRHATGEGGFVVGLSSCKKLSQLIKQYTKSLRIDASRIII
jgi:hypothetical protein